MCVWVRVRREISHDRLKRKRIGPDPMRCDDRDGMTGIGCARRGDEQENGGYFEIIRGKKLTLCTRYEFFFAGEVVFVGGFFYYYYYSVKRKIVSSESVLLSCLLMINV